VAAVPVFSTILPPLVDYPNHLARMHLIATGGDRFYAVQWAPLPNLAEDLIVPPLARLMPLGLAAKLFLVLTFALLAGGTLWLSRIAAGGWRTWPLLAFLLLYTRTFLWGFLNYLFGVGCALVGAALWLALEPRPRWLRILVSSIASLVCFLSHLAAWGVYALLILGVELPPAAGELRTRQWPALRRRLVVALPQFLLPAAVLLASPPAGGAIGYAGFWRKADLLFSVFDNYDRPFDIACFTALLLLFVGLAATRRLRLDRRLGCALALVFLAYLAVPSRLMAASGADHRLPVAGFLLLVAASAPLFPSRRAGHVIAGIAAVLLLARLAVVEQVWRDADRVYSADLAGLDTLPAGDKLAVALPADAVHFAAVPRLHLPVLAIPRRGAFVPTLFADPRQQPVVVKPPFAALLPGPPAPLLWAAFAASGAAADRAAALHALANWDDIVFTDNRAVDVRPDPCLVPLFRRSDFQIFAIVHRAGCAI
jgi:hypothetical protein